MAAKGKAPATPSHVQDKPEEESVAILLADPFEIGHHFASLTSGNNVDREMQESTSAEAEKPWVSPSTIESP